MDTEDRVSAARAWDGAPATDAALSFIQEQLWFAEQFEDSRTLYMESLAMRLRGDLSVALLERCLREVGRRHEVLRTIYPQRAGRPIQRVLPGLPLSLAPPIDLSNAADPQAALLDTAQALAEQPADLTRGPLFRCWLLRLAPRDHALLLAAHHTVADGWSMGLIMRELAALYEGYRAGQPAPLPEPRLQYADFAAWERDLLDSGVLDEGQRYWTAALAGVPAVLDLPGDRCRPPVKQFAGRREEFLVSQAVGGALTELCRRHGVTMFMVVMAGFAALARGYAGAERFVLGTPVANRPRPELADMIGYFANTLPLPMDVSGDPDLAELLRRVSETCVRSLEQQHVALEKMIESLRPVRDPTRTTLVQHVVLLKEVPVHRGMIADLEVSSFEVPRSRARFDTITEIEVTGTEVRAWVEYDTALYDRDTIAALIRHLGVLFETWTADPDLRLSQLPVLAPPVPAAPVPVAPPDQLRPAADLAPAELAAEPAIAPAAVADPTADPLRALVADIWCEVMGLDSAGGDDDFFELGGHSMLSARLTERVGEILDVDLPLRVLFENPTLAEFTDAVRRRHPDLDRVVAELVRMSESDFDALLREADDGSPDGAAAEQRPAPTHSAAVTPDGARHRLVPLSLSQEQFWLMERLRTGQLTYTIPFSFHIRGPLDVDALREAVNRVVARHESLRTTFLQLDERPMQRVAPALRLEVPLTDVSGMPASQRTAEVRHLEQVVAHHRFDLGRGPLLRAEIVRVSATEHHFFVNFHHLVTDEVSTTVFMRELSALYRSVRDGVPDPLPEPAVQFADYVAWERHRLDDHMLAKAAAHWQRKLRDAARLDVPTDLPRPPELTFDGNFLHRQAPRQLFDAMSALAKRNRVTPFMVFCAATLELLHRLSGQDDLVIGAPSENRAMPGSDAGIGCFVNVVPLRVDRSGEPTFEQFLLRVRDAVLGSYGPQAVPTAKIIEAVAPERVPNRHPLFQICCELQLDSWLPLDLPGCTYTYEIVSHGTARYDMAYHAMVKPDHLWLGLELNTNLWQESTGHRYLSMLEAGLRELLAAPQRPMSAASFGGPR